MVYRVQGADGMIRDNFGRPWSPREPTPAHVQEVREAVDAAAKSAGVSIIRASELAAKDAEIARLQAEVAELRGVVADLQAKIEDATGTRPAGEDAAEPTKRDRAAYMREYQREYQRKRREALKLVPKP
ncbi:hypothetical protein SAMN05519103_00339 [Rhizobiales bacterium GAS113]|nr:hypothetical protein SAMN05519103_00339 [Rhizobiales bacterium GAS113]